MSENKNLLPCPFCGCRATISEYTGIYPNEGEKTFVARCTNQFCKVRFEIKSPTLEEAIMDWNTRYGEFGNEQLKCRYGVKIKGLISILLGMAKVVESQGESMVDRLNVFEKELTDGESKG